MNYPTHAISIRQPWCHHILNDGKDVENRSWPTRFRGPVFIHASKGFDTLDKNLITQHKMPLGGIVGWMNIVDCVQSMQSKWFFGPHGFVIKDARPLPFFPMRGQLGFFAIPPEQLAELHASMIGPKP